MFVKLRHIHGDNLKELEKDLEKIKNPITVLGVNVKGQSWYIHFLIQDSMTDSEPLATKVEGAQLLSKRRK